MKNIFRLFFTVLFFTVYSFPLFAQWVQTNGPDGSSIMCFARNGSNFFTGTNIGVLISTDNGSNWGNAGLRDNRVQCLASSGANLFAGTSNNGIYLTTDDGVNWTSVNTGLTNSNILSLTTIGTNIFAGTFGGGVFLSTNNGASWSNLVPSNSSIYSLAANGTGLYAGTFYGVSLYTSNGTSWNAADVGLTSECIRSLAFSGDKLFAGTYVHGVYRYNGVTFWTQMMYGDMRSFTVSGSNLFAGGERGVSLSQNDGASWNDVSANLPLPYINCLAVNGTNLFAGTNSCGIWRRPLSEMVTSVEMSSNEKPAHYGLEQNYPNPFNPNTTINYRLPQSGTVTIKVYDVLGNEVKTLVNEYKSAGEYSVNFDAGKLSSGMYIYRITAGGYTSAKKMTLIK